MASRAYNFLKRGCGDRALTAGAVTALAAVTTATTRNDVLDIIRDLEIADREVASQTIGFATSVRN